MSKFFAGNTLASFIRSATTVVETTTSGRYDSAFLFSGINIPSGEYIETYTFAATGTVWIRFDKVNGSGSTTAIAVMTALNGATGVFRLLGSSSTAALQPQFWNGSAWTNTGASFSASGLATIVCRIDLNSGFECFVAGASMSSGTGWSGGQVAMDRVRCGGHWSSVLETFSQIMVADYDLTDSHYQQATLAGDSAVNTAGTGGFATVNETPTDDSTAALIAAAGKRGQICSALTIPSGYAIAGRVLNARGRVSGGTITQGKLGTRSGGTNYSSADKAFGTTYGPRGTIWETDPATGVAFSQSGFNSAEPYLEAA